MKTLQQTVFQIAMILLFASCQSETDVKKILSTANTRKEIMKAIANDDDMHKEMMTTMMDGKNGMAMMMINHESMMKTMKDKPEMMHKMMNDMMSASKSDTSMMASMCKTMMKDPQMMKMMEKMKTGNREGMKEMDHSKHQ
ncbi:MAG: hypothetical protein V4683_08040 [Bacteroidota bacterium]